MVPGSRRGFLGSSAGIHLVRAGAQKAPRLEVGSEQRARELMLMAGHDLRTPLAAIRMTVEATIRSWQSGTELSSEEWAASMIRVSRATESAFTLIDDLLAVERLRTIDGAAGLTREATDLEAVVREAISLHEDALTQARCKVILVRRNRLNPVRGPWDRGLLLRIFSNLLRNVTRHAPGAPVRITLMDRATRVGVVFADFGTGLPKRWEQQAGLVGRGDPSTESHGLGLWIVRRAVESLHGRLVIRNSPGRGLAFDIDLPGLPVRGRSGRKRRYNRVLGSPADRTPAARLRPR